MKARPAEFNKRRKKEAWREDKNTAEQLTFSKTSVNMRVGDGDPSE